MARVRVRVPVPPRARCRPAVACLLAALPVASCTPLRSLEMPQFLQRAVPSLPQVEGASVSLRSHTAFVLVVPGEEVAVEVTTRARGPSPAEARDRALGASLEIRRSPDGGLHLETLHPPAAPLASVDHTIRLELPPRFSLSVDVEEGHVCVTAPLERLRVRTGRASVTGQLQGREAWVETATGKVRLRSAAGELHVATDAAPAHVAVVDLDRPLPDGAHPPRIGFRSRSGSLTLDLPPGAALAVRRGPGEGRFTSELPLAWTGRDGPDTLGVLGDPPVRGELVVSAAAGDVLVRAAPTF